MLAMQQQQQDRQPKAPSSRQATKREGSSQSPLDTLAAAATTSTTSQKPQPAGITGDDDINAHTADSQSPDHILTSHSINEPSDAEKEKDRQLMAAVAVDDANNAFSVKADSPSAATAAAVAAAAAVAGHHHHHQTSGPHANLWHPGNHHNESLNDDSAIDTQIKALSDPNGKHVYQGYSTEAVYGNPDGFAYDSPRGDQSNAMSLERLNNPVTAQVTGGYGAYDDVEGPPKPIRKKKQCDICLRFYSNLATHKSIHLSENSRPHTCNVCGRGFARPNDLFRHAKSHRGDAPFRCPLFYKPASLPMIDGSTTSLYDPPCHQNGGFSRCDTYKNHLKAMHFEYPPGTKKRDRQGMDGKCRACKLQFNTADDWIANHIETGECEGIKRIQAKTGHIV